MHAFLTLAAANLVVGQSFNAKQEHNRISQENTRINNNLTTTNRVNHSNGVAIDNKNNVVNGADVVNIEDSSSSEVETEGAEVEGAYRKGYNHGFPGSLGTRFEFYGCVKSENNFASFKRVSKMKDMDLDFCAASCESRFMGVQGE